MRLISRCPHSQKTGIYGDEINHNGGYRLRCDNCGLLLDGPVSLAQESSQIIRSLEEARAQGQGAIFVNRKGDACTLKHLTNAMEILRSPRHVFPVAVLATGAQVNAAREALAHIPPKVVRTDSN